MAAGHVIVVGAGLAGLSAAVELKRLGVRVELYERSRLLGGKATSFEVDGVVVDNGQHVFLGCCTEFIDFVEQIESDVAGTPGTASVKGALWLQDRFIALLLSAGKRPAEIRAVGLPAPFHLLPGLLRYRNVSVLDRCRIGFALARAYRPAPAGESFDGWLRRHGQTSGARSAFWDPFFIPALNAPLDRVSAEDALFIIRTAFLHDAGAARFGFARVPLARIAEAAAGRLDGVYTRAPVMALAIEGADVRGVVLEGDQVKRADAVILAVPPARLAKILMQPELYGIDGLEKFQTAAIVDVHLWYDMPTVGFAFAAVLDSPVQWIFEKAPGYLCCSLSAADLVASRSNADLIELCHRELVTVLPRLADIKRLRGATTRDREATFIPAPGLRRPGVVTSNPRLAIAGAWTDTGWPATMESAVRSGRAAARHIIGGLASGEHRLREPLGATG